MEPRRAFHHILGEHHHRFVPRNGARRWPFEAACLDLVSAWDASAAPVRFVRERHRPAATLEERGWQCPRDADRPAGDVSRTRDGAGRARDFRRAEIPPADFPDAFRLPLRLANESRRLAEEYGVRLVAKVRGVEGILHALAGDYREAYLAYLEALATAEDLRVRYHLGVTLMVGSVSFLRPIYHFERILALAPPYSRLAQLARNQRDEALRVYWLNVHYAASTDVFELITFSQWQIETCEDDDTAGTWRDDGSKRAAFGYWPDYEPVDSSHVGPGSIASEGRPLPMSGEREVHNEEIKRDVTVRAVS